jgi:hypothetical protein
MVHPLIVHGLWIGASSLSLDDLERDTGSMALSLDGSHDDTDANQAATSQPRTLWEPSPLRSNAPHLPVVRPRCPAVLTLEALWMLVVQGRPL